MVWMRANPKFVLLWSRHPGATTARGLCVRLDADIQNRAKGSLLRFGGSGGPIHPSRDLIRLFTRQRSSWCDPVKKLGELAAIRGRHTFTQSLGHYCLKSDFFSRSIRSTKNLADNGVSGLCNAGGHDGTVQGRYFSGGNVCVNWAPSYRGG